MQTEYSIEQLLTDPESGALYTKDNKPVLAGQATEGTKYTLFYFGSHFTTSFTNRLVEVYYET